MGKRDSDSKLYTRGGQIWLNNWRMLLQVNKTLLHSLLMVSAALACVFVWFFASWDVLQGAYYYVCAFLLSKAWMSDYIFHLTYHGEPMQIIASGTSGVLQQGYFNDQFHQLIRLLEWGACVGGAVSIVGVLIFRSYFIRKGVKQSEPKFIRGAKMAKSGKFAEAVRKSESGASDINVSGIPMVRHFEVKHTLIHGTTGSGKGQTLGQFIDAIRKRGDSAVIFDKGCVFTGLFHDEETDVILNPFDQRCAKWDLWAEAESEPDFENIAKALIPKHGESDPYWVDSARAVFSAVAYKMRNDKDRSMNKLLSLILTAELGDLGKYLEGTEANILASDKIEKTAISIRSVISTYLKSLRFLKGLEPKDNEGFSIRHWIKGVADSDRSHFMFVSSNAEHHASLRSLMSMWLSMSSIRMLSLEENFDRRLWFICDELPSLHKLPNLGETIAEIRKFGGCFVLGMQSYSQLQSVYGTPGAKGIFDLLNTRFFFRSPSSDMAEMVSKELGKEEVEQTSESYSYGSNTVRDGISIGTQTVTRPLVSSSEIMNMRDMQAYVRVPEDVPVTKIKLRYRFRKKVSKPFLLRVMPGDKVEVKSNNEGGEINSDQKKSGKEVLGEDSPEESVPLANTNQENRETVDHPSEYKKDNSLSVSDIDKKSDEESKPPNKEDGKEVVNTENETEERVADEKHKEDLIVLDDRGPSEIIVN